MSATLDRLQTLRPRCGAAWDRAAARGDWDHAGEHLDRIRARSAAIARTLSEG